MKKVYHLIYHHAGGKRHLDFPTLFEFTQHLDKIIEDPQVVDSTIEFYTVTVKA